MLCMPAPRLPEPSNVSAFYQQVRKKNKKTLKCKRVIIVLQRIRGKLKMLEVDGKNIPAMETSTACATKASKQSLCGISCHFLF